MLAWVLDRVIESSWATLLPSLRRILFFAIGLSLHDLVVTLSLYLCCFYPYSVSSSVYFLHQHMSSTPPMPISESNTEVTLDIITTLSQGRGLVLVICYVKS